MRVGARQKPWERAGSRGLAWATSIVCALPRGHNANSIYSVTQPHWVTETTSKELPVKSPKR